MKITNYELEDVKSWDYPDFCDAYISYAEDENGKEITALNFLHKYADNELTNAESIRRMRAKLQEEEPGLRGEAYKIRKGKLQEVFLKLRVR